MMMIVIKIMMNAHKNADDDDDDHDDKDDNDDSNDV
jgi:hypothetical protein